VSPVPDFVLALRDKIGHDWRNQETYDPDDGSVVDW